VQRDLIQFDLAVNEFSLGHPRRPASKTAVVARTGLDLLALRNASIVLYRLGLIQYYGTGKYLITEAGHSLAERLHGGRCHPGSMRLQEVIRIQKSPTLPGGEGPAFGGPKSRGSDPKVEVVRPLSRDRNLMVRGQGALDRRGAKS
jgi:hypothetical protein